MHLQLTQDGQRFADEYITPVFTAENRVFSEMSTEETRQLLALTKKYTELLRKNTGEILESPKEKEAEHT